MMGSMLLAEIVDASAARRRHPVAHGQGRTILAEVLGARRAGRAGGGDGLPRRASCGSGAPAWAGGPPARLPRRPTSRRWRCSRWTRPSTELAGLAGAGLAGPAASATVAEMFGRATPEEQAWLRGVVTGEVRQGALDALVQEWVSPRAAGVPLTAVRPRGDAGRLDGGDRGRGRRSTAAGRALAEFRLEVGRPVLPMLASSAPTRSPRGWREALADGEVAVDSSSTASASRCTAGARCRSPPGASRTSPPDFPRWSRSSGRSPPSASMLDGEASRSTRRTATAVPGDRVAHPTGAAAPSRRTSSTAPHRRRRPHRSNPAPERLAALDALVPEAHRAPRLVTAAEAAQVFDDSVPPATRAWSSSRGTPYAAGRRGAGGSR